VREPSPDRLLRLLRELATSPAVRAQVSTKPRTLPGGATSIESWRPPAPGALIGRCLPVALRAPTRRSASITDDGGRACPPPRQRVQAGNSVDPRRRCTGCARAPAPAPRLAPAAATAVRRAPIGNRRRSPVPCSLQRVGEECGAVSPAGPRNTLPARAGPTAIGPPGSPSGAPVYVRRAASALRREPSEARGRRDVRRGSAAPPALGSRRVARRNASSVRLSRPQLMSSPGRSRPAMVIPVGLGHPIHVTEPVRPGHGSAGRRTPNVDSPRAFARNVSR